MERPARCEYGRLRRKQKLLGLLPRCMCVWVYTPNVCRRRTETGLQAGLRCGAVAQVTKAPLRTWQGPGPLLWRALWWAPPFQFPLPRGPPQSLPARCGGLGPPCRSLSLFLRSAGLASVGPTSRAWSPGCLLSSLHRDVSCEEKRGAGLQGSGLHVSNSFRRAGCHSEPPCPALLGGNSGQASVASLP